MIVTDTNDEDDDDVVGFMPSHLHSEMDSFQDSLASLMQRALELSCVYVLLNDGCTSIFIFQWLWTYFKYLSIFNTSLIQTGLS